MVALALVPTNQLELHHRRAQVEQSPLPPLVQACSSRSRSCACVVLLAPIRLVFDCDSAFHCASLWRIRSTGITRRVCKGALNRNRLLPISTSFECRSRASPTSVRRAYRGSAAVGTLSLSSGRPTGSGLCRPDGRLRPDPLALPTLRRFHVTGIYPRRRRGLPPQADPTTCGEA